MITVSFSTPLVRLALVCIRRHHAILKTCHPKISAPQAILNERNFATKKKKNDGIKKNKEGQNLAKIDQKGDVLKRFMKMIDAEIDRPPTQSDEVMTRWFEIGRAYNAGMARRHNHIQHDLACKIKMKVLAMESLPRDAGIREAAFRVDEFNPKDHSGSVPLWRHIPSDLPPIKDFDLKDYYQNEQD
mmetsp:Transcript_18213/g.41503  ORF Transcript_18213/g.41503 Transcript_18213/m.41503 type:complete len:187 (-) Transcript_18213:1929-2489(-)|eukprot:CAMPEP_0113315192 /NCGR_PEP_ID=MMETSP0010_2-20120614/10956_1 /TAXON_ID=216773 ORGANISM="Corethron hystrix, Strain 308" /NCGR_SAMPLE_ID=MMETSP0010_2 /ASSEMBLY_ACC=CAM_ASM_000155 /LENGTH=186 /DNA_ID=CAMNT_0000171639 /DNA_START=200 /DNA_END=760 /DNA_ORIENTATION=- /assembly_acc=CAM_ASM_000155